MGQFFWLLLGVVFAIFAQVIIRIWFVHVDENSKRFDDFCEVIDEAKSIGCEYWCKGGSDPEIRNLETKIHSAADKVELYLMLLETRHWAIRDLCEKEILAFYDALTGGQFEVVGRPADHEKARDCSHAAYELVISVRKHRRNLFRAVR